MKPEDLPERIASKIAIDRASGCWLWTGFVADGYGRAWWEGRTWLAHRLAYTLLVGPIPEGLQLDHVKDRGCTSRACVNPAHLEPVTSRENTLRGDGPGGQHARQTHCHNGHEFTSENTYLRSGPNGVSRCCRTCRKTYDRTYYERRQEAS